ncbi:MAG: helix-turn-helix transcriptional regulator [Myxococcota bacterium]|nr:helix-turn-helix transcriptional regulator [Myxococcota bacterium]
MSAAGIGKRIRELRRARGLSQQALAEKAGISVTYASQLERNIGNPTLSTIQQLATALQVDPADIIRQAEGSAEDEAAVLGAVSGVIDQKDPEKLRRLRTFLEEVFR